MTPRGKEKRTPHLHLGCFMGVLSHFSDEESTSGEVTAKGLFFLFTAFSPPFSLAHNLASGTLLI
jgi:hypothetical protein